MRRSEFDAGMISEKVGFKDGCLSHVIGMSTILVGIQAGLSLDLSSIQWMEQKFHLLLSGKQLIYWCPCEPTAFGCYELQPTLKALQSDRMLNPMAQLHETRNRFPLQGAIAEGIP